MSWTPTQTHAHRIELSPEGQFVVLERSYEHRGQRKPGTPSYDHVQDLEQELWATVASYNTLMEACLLVYVRGLDNNQAIREVDLGGLDPLGTEVTFVKEQFEKLTI